MFSKILIASAIVAYVMATHHATSYSNIMRHDSPAEKVYVGHHGHHGGGGGGGHGDDKHYDYVAYPKYQYQYGVEDDHTGDKKSAHEERDGDVVKGEYSVKEADGTTRTVKYVADKHTGFHAEVLRSGHAAHPAHYGHHH